MEARQYEYAARGYCNLAELLLRARRLDELEACVEEGLRFARERGFWSHAYNLEVHRCVALLRRGRWERARAGCASWSRAWTTPGCSTPTACRGSGGCWRGAATRRPAPMLASAWSSARRQRLLLGVAYAGLAYVEWAWLAGEPESARRVAAELEPRVEHPGGAPFRAELLRYLARAGVPAEPFAGCPEPWAAGLRGDWRAAAGGWEAAGDPYEQALELAESGEPEPTLEGLRILDGLGATAPAALVARAGCGRWARGCRAGRRRRRAPTPRGSPSASSPCSGW